VISANFSSVRDELNLREIQIGGKNRRNELFINPISAESDYIFMSF